MPRPTLLCLQCHLPARSRGLCWACHSRLRRAVARGDTTWEAAVRSGLCLAWGQHRYYGLISGDQAMGPDQSTSS